MEANKKTGEITIAASQSLKEREYWMKKLSGEFTKTSFFYDFQEADNNEHRFEKVKFAFTGEQHSKLIKLSNNSDPRLFMIITAGLITILYKYTGNKDIIVGTSIEKQEIEEDFINMVLPLRNQIVNPMSFKELLLQVRDTVIEAMENKNYPIEAICYDLKLSSSAEHNFPLFDIAVLLENIQSREYLRHIKINMIFSFSKIDHSIEGVLEFNPEFYRKETVERIIHHFILTIRQVLNNLDIPLSHIEILPEEEKHRLLFEFNNTGAGYPGDKLLHELFEEEVEKRSGKTALVFEDKHMDYMALNEKANRMAGFLREKGVVGDTIVGLMVDISLDMVIGMLSILKAGGAFLPIEVDYPGDRKNYMMEDSNIPVVLVQTTMKDKIETKFNREVIDLQEYHGIEGDGSKPPKISQPGNLAYVIYTSGSTGDPKGVMIRHKNIVNQLFGLQKRYSFNSTLNHILMAPFTFDPSVQQIFLPLSTGGKLFLVSKNIKNDGNELSRFLFVNHISILNTVPSLLNILLDSVNKENGKRLHFEYIILAGEVFSGDLYQKLKSCLTSGKIINIYGPTEATINTTLYECKNEEKKSLIPIGKPLLNYKVWTLDKHLHMLPISVPGELCISGDGVARGYLNKVELTGEKFVMDALERDKEIYRTGDSARWLPDGTIEFLGRLDNQVKIRGCRVELGEIESHLLMHDAISEVAVIPKEDRVGEKTLYAYFSKYKPQEDDIASPGNASKEAELWPSHGEYLIWDEILYYSMTFDKFKNKSFERAINKLVKDKTVVEIGTGQDVVLARLCVEAGVKKVFAVEILEEAYKKAIELVKKHGLEDKIILIHGDATNVELPEKVDVCLANQLGTIASSEGAIVLHNSARRFLKEESVVIPEKSITKIAAVYLPQNIYEKPQFSELGKRYQEKIFEKIGHRFDLRLCVKDFPRSNIISNIENFEEINFQEMIDIDSNDRLQLVINKNARIDGFLLWLHLYTIAEDLIDVLDNKYSSWAPFYVPVFYPGVKVAEGDIININVMRSLSKDNYSFDYRIKGVLKRQGEEDVEFDYNLPYYEENYEKTTFYQGLFKNNLENIKSDFSSRTLSARKLRRYLENKLPDYMIPSYFIQLETMPLTPNGKVDKKALYSYEKKINSGVNYVAPQNEREKIIAGIWREVLGIEKVGVYDNFFDIGGHSLSLVEVNDKLHEIFSKNISVSAMFRYPTISSLAEYFKQEKTEGLTPGTDIRIDESVNIMDEATGVLFADEIG